MRVGTREFSPPGLIVALYVAFVAAMLALGSWQLQRAAEKNAMLLAEQAAAGKPAVDVQSIDNLVAAAVRYQRVTASGRFLAEHQLLWDNRVHNGQAGFEVITPLQLATGEIVLVNRGWIAPGATRADLPDVSIGEAVLAVEVSLEGTLTRPSRGFASGPSMDQAAAWPKLLQYMDYDELAMALEATVLPVVLQPVPATGQAGMLELVWQPTAFGPERHYGYAFQWFAMAVALTALFVFLNLKPARVE